MHLPILAKCCMLLDAHDVVDGKQIPYKTSSKPDQDPHPASRVRLLPCPDLMTSLKRFRDMQTMERQQ